MSNEYINDISQLAENILNSATARAVTIGQVITELYDSNGIIEPWGDVPITAEELHAVYEMSMLIAQRQPFSAMEVKDVLLKVHKLLGLMQVNVAR